MSDSNLISQGVGLMINGMGTVFVFLVVLIFLTKGMSYIVSKFPEKEVAAPKKAATNVPSDELQQVAVAAAAVQAYKSRT